MISELELQTKKGEAMFASQSQFTNEANKRGTVIASIPDIYHTAKVGNEDLFNKLFKTLDGVSGSRLITSTRIYTKDNFSKIIHYHGSEIVVPFEKEVVTTDLDRWRSNIGKSKEILEFLKALFNTDDDAEEIIGVISRVKRNILIKTPEGKETGVCLVKTDRRVVFDCNQRLSGGSYYSSVEPSAYKGYAREVTGDLAGLEQKLSARGRMFTGLSFGINSEINEANNCVYFTNTQQIGNFTKYSGLFCFHKERYLALITSKTELNGVDKVLSEIFAKQKSVKEKLEELGNLLSPVYLHLERYTEGKNEYKQIDDLEIFGGI